MDSIKPVIDFLHRHIQPNQLYREHDLIKALAQAALSPFDALNLKDSKNLFSAHFLIRHCLYHLQDRYAQLSARLHTKRFVLHLTAVGAELHCYSSPSETPTKTEVKHEFEPEPSSANTASDTNPGYNTNPDFDSRHVPHTTQIPPTDPALKAYYLDISHYFETTAEEVDELLNSFWRRYLKQEDQDQAYRRLGLEPGASYTEVKQRYRQLAQQHHPDKGGDNKTFQEIAAAKRLLTQVLK